MSLDARPRLVLASASPARLATLRAAGLRPDVVVSGVDEDAVVAEHGVTEPGSTALLLARAKAAAVAERPAAAEALVLGCDSVLDVAGRSRGKPGEPTVARRRWQELRGAEAVLHTGHWLIDTRDRSTGGTGTAVGELSSTTVRFADLDDAEIDAYVATGEPLQVAGGFTLDGLGGAYVDHVAGDPHAVVGVGLATVRRLAAVAGVRWSSLWCSTEGGAGEDVG